MSTSENNKLLFWALNALWTILLSISLMWVSSLSHQTEIMKADIATLQQIAATSTANIVSIQDWLERVESKLDRVLYQK